MLFFAPLLVLGAIGFFCWLLFTLAVFALPAFVGVTIGIWSVHTGAGVLGGILISLAAAGLPATAPRTESRKWPCRRRPGR